MAKKDEVSWLDGDTKETAQNQKQPQKKKTKKTKKTTRELVIYALGLTIWTGAVFFVAQVAVVWLIRWLITLVNVPVNSTVLQAVCAALSYIVALVVMIKVPKLVLKMKVTRDGMGLHGMPTWTDILLSPIGYIVSMILTIGVLLVLQAFTSIDLTQEQDVGFNNVYTGMDRMITFIALVVLAPVAEELIFRGWLYGKLREKMAVLPAIILVSVLFGAMHGQWNVGVVVAIMSVVMCLAREVTGTIYAGMLMHMIRNGIAFYLLYVNPSMGAGMTAMASLPLYLAFLL